MRFPGIGIRVKDEINKHIACLATSQPNHPKPLQSPPMPPHEWHEVKINSCGRFPSCHYVLAIIDLYSRYPEIEIIM